MEIQSLFVLLSIVVHLTLAVVQCFLFSDSKYLQKFYLRKYFENSDALEVLKLLLTNYGAYHALVALIGIIGQFIESYHLIQGVMVIFLTNGLSIIWNRNQSPLSYFIAFIQFFPSLMALLLPSHLDSIHEQQLIDFPLPALLLPATFHLLFFVFESLLFTRFHFIQKLFLGKFSKSPEAVMIGGEYFFDQGLYNLKLALLTLSGLFVTKSPSVVISTLLVYVGAGIVLLISSPRLWKGFLTQAGPALYGLYLLAPHAEVIYYELLRSIFSEDDEDH
jgi:putative membrane protein